MISIVNFTTYASKTTAYDRSIVFVGDFWDNDYKGSGNMTKKLSEFFANFLVDTGAAAPDKRAVILFGLELLLSSIISILIIIFISITFGFPFLWLPFLLAFIPLRTTAGGYHAATHTGCNITFALAYFVCIIVCKYVAMQPPTYIIISVMSVVTILLFSPVEAINKPLDDVRKSTNRARSIIIILAVAIASVFAWLFSIHNIGIQMFYLGVFAAMVSQIAALIINYKGENKNESKV